MVEEETAWRHSSSRYYKLNQEDVLVDRYEVDINNGKELRVAEKNLRRV